MGWNEEDAPEMSMILDPLAECLERLVEMIRDSCVFEELAKLAEEIMAKPEPSMNTTMHITAHSADKGLSLAAVITPNHSVMRQHTAATGM